MNKLILIALLGVLLASCSQDDDFPLEQEVITDQVRRIKSIDISESWIDTTVYLTRSYKINCEYDNKRRISEMTYTRLDKNGSESIDRFEISYKDKAIDACRIFGVKRDGNINRYDTTCVSTYTLNDKNLIDRIDERYSILDDYQYAYQVSEYENGYFKKGVYHMQDDPCIMDNTCHYVNGNLDSYRMTMQLEEDWSRYSYEEYTWSYMTFENKLQIPGQVLFGVFWYSFLNQVNSSPFLDPFFYQMGFYGKQLPYWEKSGKSQVFDVNNKEEKEMVTYDYSYQYEFDGDGYPTTMKVTLGYSSTPITAEYVFHFTYLI